MLIQKQIDTKFNSMIEIKPCIKIAKSFSPLKGSNKLMWIGSLDSFFSEVFFFFFFFFFFFEKILLNL